MSRRGVIFLLLAIVLVFGLVFWAAYALGGSINSKLDWQEHYSETSKQPYGLYLFGKVAETYFDGFDFDVTTKPPAKMLPDDESIVDANYMFVGEGLYLDTSDVNQLLEFVGRGNKAFIAAKAVPYDLMDYVYYEECNYNYWEDYHSVMDSMVTVSVGNLSVDMKHQNTTDTEDWQYNYYEGYRWPFLDQKFICPEDMYDGFKELGSLKPVSISAQVFSSVENNYYNAGDGDIAFGNSFANYLSIPYGDGEFYFYTTPILFTNYYLKDSAGVEYIEHILGYLHDGDTYYDTGSRVKESVTRRMNNSYDPRLLNSKGPMTFIMQQRSLKWAIYSILALAALYFMFKAKRRQRPIPIIPPVKNTTLEFNKAMGELYFQTGNHRKIALKLKGQLLSFIRDRYRIPTSELDGDFITRLSNAAKLPPREVERLVELLNETKHLEYEDDLLVELFQRTNEFYTTSR